MRRRGGTYVPGKHKPLRMGPPRVVEDEELYQIVASLAADNVPEAKLDEYVRTWCKPWQDWQLSVIALRARLFLACVRKELGRRKQLDPNQLRLKEGL